jgi:hypothetical protein
MSKIALAGIATTLIAFVFILSGWASPWLQYASRLHGKGAAQVHTKRGDNQAHYLGSIIVSPRRGDKCWELGLDNRTGAMWNKGYVDCDVVPPLKALQDQARGLAARRLKAIGQAFSPKDQ